MRPIYLFPLITAIILLGAGCAKPSPLALDRVLLNSRAEFTDMAERIAGQEKLWVASVIKYAVEKKTCEIINNWQHCSDEDTWSKLELGADEGKLRYAPSAAEVLAEEGVNPALYQATVAFLSRHGLTGAIRTGDSGEVSVQFLDGANGRLVYFPSAKDKNMGSTVEESGEFFRVKPLVENWYEYRPL